VHAQKSTSGRVDPTSASVDLAVLVEVDEDGARSVVVELAAADAGREGSENADTPDASLSLPGIRFTSAFKSTQLC